MVPGSTLMYGSSFSMVTLRPRDSRIAAREAAAIPLPREDTTPPVTNTNLVITEGAERHVREMEIIPENPFSSPPNRAAGLIRFKPAPGSGVQQRLGHLVHRRRRRGRMLER